MDLFLLWRKPSSPWPHFSALRDLDPDDPLRESGVSEELITSQPDIAGSLEAGSSVEVGRRGLRILQHKGDFIRSGAVETISSVGLGTWITCHGGKAHTVPNLPRFLISKEEGPLELQPLSANKPETQI